MALSKILPASQEQYVGSRNLIINGNFGIDQRNSGSAVTSTGPIYTVDRWTWSTQTGSGHTVQQVTDAPADFNNSVKVTIGTGASPSTSQQNNFVQQIEGNNFSHLNFGSSDARGMTFSFYVKSSITGTFNVWFHNSGNARHYVSEYTVSLANTWERKIITISSGDATGTWNTDNSTGVIVGFSLGAGTDFDTTVNSWADGGKKSTSSATDLVATSGATWQITGIQLEVGNATPFEHEPFAVTQQKCQRYYQKSYSYSDTAGTVTNNGALWTNIIRNASNQNYWQVRLNQEMRTNVSVTTYSTTSGVSGKFRNVTDNATNDSAVSNTGSSGFSIRPSSGSGQDLGDVIAVHWVADAEL